MNVVYSTDDGYVRHAYVSIYSLLENNKDMKNITIYILCEHVSEENKRLLRNLTEDYQRKCVFIQIPNMMVSLHLKSEKGYPLVGYSRLLADKLLPCDKAIYLDSDTLVVAPLRELWNMHMNDSLIAGVQDTVTPYFRESIGMKKGEKYINAGILLLNLRKWREDNIHDQMLQFIDKFEGIVPHHDQGIYNGVCRGRIMIIPAKYNVMTIFYSFSAKNILSMSGINEYYSQKELDEVKQHPAILHFTEGYLGRPWNRICTHPHRRVYLEYLNKTPWKENILDTPIKRNVQISKWMFHYTPFPFFKFITYLAQKRKKIKSSIHT